MEIHLHLMGHPSQDAVAAGKGQLQRTGSFLPSHHVSSTIPSGCFFVLEDRSVSTHLSLHILVFITVRA